MNPIPDRGKECLPPKKRESRQGSSEHQLPPPDEFKPPVPLRSRSNAGRGEGSREVSDRQRTLNTPNSHLLHTPPPLPPPAPLPLPLPWPLSYSSPVSLPLFQGHVVERRGSGSPAWRDDPLSSPLPHHSRWLRAEGPLSSLSSTSSFKTPFPADSREMWSYMNSGRRDYSSSVFSPSYLFGHTALYPQEPSLAEARQRYLGKRPNGLDGPGSRTASTSRPLLTGDYGHDSSRTRLDTSPQSSHTNGGRRQQEDLTPEAQSRGSFSSDSKAQEVHDSHSSIQDRHRQEIPTSPHPLGPDPRVGRGGLLDAVVASGTEAHIYYSLGSVCQPSPKASQSYPPYSPSGIPLYNLQVEPGPKKHNPRNSPQSSQDQLNSHDRSQRDHDRDQDKDRDKDRERGKEKDKHLKHNRDHVHTSPPALHSSPPALLPHFTKGSLIELASGQLKQVEDLRTEDFLRSADTSPEFHLSTCTVLLISPSSAQGISHLQVHLTDRNTQELLKVLVEYPFFVQGQGWSSCCPRRTTELYGLPCRQLTEGDVCLALTPTPKQPHRTHARSSSRVQRAHHLSRAAVGGSSSSNREKMPPPPPPPPLPLHPPATGPQHALTAEPQTEEPARPRKRRWSAPDTLPSTGTDESLMDLPQGSKLMKWQ
ncbi:mediator of RNA polymerase II transcription subunit 1.1 [Dunckerocampus dactyliophorus]|uniref:mediator of RNA polymerase II transcription subunit 1.1 n=1 Tax=Dunckerocampus dactyliophorus TaxID=161453 RepID=UPI0024075284|nr:mediator of RNA polymerase II transcription subunit 1.1 [Dunckerocampus dactyliophorus]XP_054628601.1 mediator of RNA polymerase II transcription subunit 1.1 [Dunckerocampus dactyliophorus]XP_054628610.1 mediator of RNA polymerase II transcription subunit 1.1 [Dunckerocampus dactyliophorus]XP_054628615.1 mediator of RNA polymerase II transcription subunit 1.1 [Dunckerocampus dactyliophorus]